MHGFFAHFSVSSEKCIKKNLCGEYPQVPWLHSKSRFPSETLRMFDVTCTALEMVMLAHARPSGNISCLA
jgi:hypothetical protein